MKNILLSLGYAVHDIFTDLIITVLSFFIFFFCKIVKIFFYYSSPHAIMTSHISILVVSNEALIY